jgi:hypothetical protein
MLRQCGWTTGTPCSLRLSPSAGPSGLPLSDGEGDRSRLPAVLPALASVAMLFQRGHLPLIML